MSQEPPKLDQVATSPTGKPVLPPAAIPWLMGVVGTSAVVAPLVPPHTIVAQVLHFLAVVGGALLGIASPGLRRK